MSQPSKRQVAAPATGLLINNHWIASEMGKTFATSNPLPTKKSAPVSEAADDVEKAVKEARTPLELGPWRKTSASERRALLHRLADLIEDNADERASLVPSSTAARDAG